VRSDASSQINFTFGGIALNGTQAILGVWNMYNRVAVRGLIGDSADSWTYSTAVWRPANNSNTMRASFIRDWRKTRSLPSMLTLRLPPWQATSSSPLATTARRPCPAESFGDCKLPFPLAIHPAPILYRRWASTTCRQSSMCSQVAP